MKKKTLAFLAAFTLVFSMTACGNTADSSDENVTTTTTTATTTTTTETSMADVSEKSDDSTLSSNSSDIASEADVPFSVIDSQNMTFVDSSTIKSDDGRFLISLDYGVIDNTFYCQVKCENLTDETLMISPDLRILPFMKIKKLIC